MHGLTLQVFGEKGGLRWAQEHPNQLYWNPINESVRILERGEPALAPEAQRASWLAIGHAEGAPAAFANLYQDLAEDIRARKDGRDADPLALNYPKAIDGLRSMAAIEAAAASAKQGGGWVDAKPRL